MSDETTRPKTYGEKRVRGHLPGTMQFEDSYWWRELGAEIDEYLAELERLRAKVAELEQFRLSALNSREQKGGE